MGRGIHIALFRFARSVTISQAYFTHSTVDFAPTGNASWIGVPADEQDDYGINRLTGQIHFLLHVPGHQWCGAFT